MWQIGGRGAVLALSLAGCQIAHVEEGELVDLAAGLAGAACGDVLRVRPGEYAGPLVVPAGVRVVVEPPGAATVGTHDRRVVALDVRTGDCGPTSVEGLAVEADGGAAVRVIGAGTAALSDLALRVRRGLGLVVDGPTRVTASRVEIVGDIAQPDELRYPINTADVPVLGLVVANVEQATLEDVQVTGFAGVAATLQCSGVTWRGGAVAGSVGTAVLQTGGEVTLTDVAVSDSTKCPHLSCAVAGPVYAYVMVEGARLTTTRMTLRDNAGFGLVQDRSSSEHVDLTVSGHAGYGVWVQGTNDDPWARAFTLSGAGSVLTDSGGANLVSVASAGVRLTGARIGPATERAVPCGELCMELVEDGVHVAGVEGAVVLTDLDVEVQGGVGIRLLADEAGLGSVDVQDVRFAGQPGASLCLPPGLRRPPRWTTDGEDPAVVATACAETSGWGGKLEALASGTSETCRDDLGLFPEAGDLAVQPPWLIDPVD